MKLYKLEAVTNYIQTKAIKMNLSAKQKNDIKNFLMPSFIIDRYLIDEISLFKHYSLNMLVSHELVEEHVSALQDKYDIKINTEKLKKFIIDFNENDIVKYKINSFPVDFDKIRSDYFSHDSIQSLIKDKQFKVKQDKERKEHFESILLDEFPKDITKRKIFSLDFEYDKDKIYDVGISLYDNGSVINKYYITNLKKGTRDNQFRFQFGESNTASIDTVMRLVKRYIEQSDYLLFHGGYNDIIILNSFGIELKDYQHIKLLDTYSLYPNHFNNGSINKTSLTDILNKFDLEHEHLHNAGNDAVYTLKAFLKMNESYLLKDLIKPKEKPLKLKL